MNKVKQFVDGYQQIQKQVLQLQQTQKLVELSGKQEGFRF